MTKQKEVNLNIQAQNNLLEIDEHGCRDFNTKRHTSFKLKNFSFGIL